MITTDSIIQLKDIQTLKTLVNLNTGDLEGGLSLSIEEIEHFDGVKHDFNFHLIKTNKLPILSVNHNDSQALYALFTPKGIKNGDRLSWIKTNSWIFNRPSDIKNFSHKELKFASKIFMGKIEFIKVHELPCLLDGVLCNVICWATDQECPNPYLYAFEVGEDLSKSYIKFFQGVRLENSDYSVM